VKESERNLKSNGDNARKKREEKLGIDAMTMKK
jgi:hypothetical protein